MADAATPPAAANGEAKQQFVRPEKPDEVEFKDKLYKLEKTHLESQTKFVSRLGIASTLTSEPHPTLS